MFEKLDVPLGNVIITGFYRDNIFIQVSPTSGREKDKQLLKHINENRQASIIVYVTFHEVCNIFILNDRLFYNCRQQKFKKNP